ncbi:MAG TPA: dual specificity protein phosphatase family protein [Pyrinomonadaceae bacterium]|nr:dual specificity protein phosphatase family protein [Pyrinomonadaceae bacterium]
MIRKVLTLRYALLAIGIFAVAVVWNFPTARMSEVPGISIPNFAKVNDHYYRGSQPTAEQFAQLKQFGIKTVIDLRGDYKKDEEASVRDLGMNFFRIPMKTRVAATEEQTAYFLGLVNDPANWPVYVHCKGGRHRTGAMTGVYRITHDGWTANQVWEEMKKYDFENGLFGGPSAQKKYVFTFYQRRYATSNAQR